MNRDVTLSRAVTFERELLRAVATSVVALPYGEGVLTEDLPAVHDFNLVVVDADPHPDPQLVRSDTDELLAATGARHRHVRYDAVGTAYDAQASFVAAGWEPYRLVVLVWAGARPAWPAAARRLSLPEVDVITRRLTAARPWAESPERVEMFVRLARRTLQVSSGQVVGAVAEGTVQAAARIYGSGAVRQIEDVEVLEAQRGTGLGRVLMSAALHEALRGDPELVFVVAEENDWTVRWYERLGFRPVGGTGGFKQHG